MNTLTLETIAFNVLIFLSNEQPFNCIESYLNQID